MSDMTPPPPPTPVAPVGGPSSNAKLIALLGWIFAPLGIIAIFLDDYKNDMWVRSHVIQAAAVSIALWVIGWVVIAVTFGLAALFWWIFPLGIQIFYGIKAYNGSSVEVPVIYGFVKSFIAQTS